MKRLGLLLGAIAMIGVCLTGYWLFAGKSAFAGNNHASGHASGPRPAATIDGPLANATVSFGAWRMPLDRHPNVQPPPVANHHELIPQVAKIKAGGSVNFIISGLHQVIVYDDGTQASDINPGLLSLPPPGSPLPPLIDDPDGRLYRGPDPRVLLPTLDRVEVVHFANPGTYLVICGVLPHFQQGMFGFVKVLP
jgi:plastocyanin